MAVLPIMPNQYFSFINGMREENKHLLRKITKEDRKGLQKDVKAQSQKA
jgi:hypothetical protein